MIIFIKEKNSHAIFDNSEMCCESELPFYIC